MPTLRGVRRRVRDAAVFFTLIVPMLGALPASAAAGDLVSIRSAGHRATDAVVGNYRTSKLSVDVVLSPRNVDRMSALVTRVTDPRSPGYGFWLGRGQVANLFGPSAAERAAVTRYLRSRGLFVAPAAESPFWLRASGSSDAIATAFNTTLRTYRSALTGTTYFANATEAQVPAALATAVRGVAGLTDTVRHHANFKRAPFRAATPHGTSGCEAPYPTIAQLEAAVTVGTPFPDGYGGAPGCNGLTPSQLTGIYGAPRIGRRGEGEGANVAVFELSAYRKSDIATYTKKFFGGAYRAPLVDIAVDGGPLAPVCPPGDPCPPDDQYYSGDIEVDLDIESQLAVAPAVSHLLVYNAPDDYQGLTELDEYARIASDDYADSISSSWGLCENDLGLATADAENLIFEQLALQGQSMFASAGDDGAFDCLDADGTNVVNVDDPESQPWVTSVGGTSFGSFDPGTDERPAYPRAGVETVWNVDNLCSTRPYAYGLSGYQWCADVGAGGGGTSQFWTRPYYQSGRGLPPGDRHVPDVAAVADEFTAFGEYCTGSAKTPYSTCAQFSGEPAGWFAVGGTSLSAPIWAAIIADRAGYQKHRSGNINPLAYEFYDDGLQRAFAHDITGIDQKTNNNGLFYVRPGYDEATGLGSPEMTPIITNALP